MTKTTHSASAAATFASIRSTTSKGSDKNQTHNETRLAHKAAAASEHLFKQVAVAGEEDSADKWEGMSDPVARPVTKNSADTKYFPNITPCTIPAQN